MTARARLETIGERPVLRLERRLTHSPEQVWLAITEPAEVAKWFPATTHIAELTGPPSASSVHSVA